MPLPYTHFVKDSTIVGAPADNLTGTAPGQDPLGCNLSNATYDHTGGASGERQLTAASGTPFANVLSGDYIYLINAAGGVTDGLYAIASKISSTVILLEADSGLTADSTADVDSSRGPWKTLQFAFDNVTAGGDHLVICDDGNGAGTEWKPTVKTDVDAGAPSDVEPIIYRGGSGRGVVDGTIATLDGGSLGSLVHLIQVAGGTKKRRWLDLRFTNTAIGHNLYSTDTLSVDHQFIRCRFDSAALAGVAARPNDWFFADCQFDNNGTWGRMPNTATVANTARGAYLRCRFHDNTNGGIQATEHLFMSQCLIYDNGGPGLRFYKKCYNAIIDGCVFFGNTGDGVEGINSFNGMSPMLITNTVFRSNGGHGVDIHFSLPIGVGGAFFAEIDHSGFHNNTGGITNKATPGGIMGGSGADLNVYTDPKFVSETDGSEDFDLQDSSPLIDAGIAVPEK